MVRVDPPHLGHLHRALGVDAERRDRADHLPVVLAEVVPVLAVLLQRGLLEHLCHPQRQGPLQLGRAELVRVRGQRHDGHGNGDQDGRRRRDQHGGPCPDLPGVRQAEGSSHVILTAEAAGE
ncbi:hypothetical protein GCM10020219_075870 [Nonomuraea dietziae]